jgi:hypothetical protein
MRSRIDPALEPIEILGLGLRPAHDQKGTVAEPSHREIGLDAPAVVQPLRVDDLAGRYRDIVRAHMVQHPLGIGAFEAELGE